MKRLLILALSTAVFATAQSLPSTDNGTDKTPPSGAMTPSRPIPDAAHRATAPILIHSVEADYTDEARRALLNGTAIIRVIVGVDGKPQRIELLKDPGMGLGDKAVAAVKKYRFKPAVVDGKPVVVYVTVAVEFKIHR
ncbi:MAG: TonB family protein [Acidobacteriaceae bacterium]|nr:TonB family protein [Acidobacteriaceae bacterium]